MTRAVALFSGGLDSILACRLMASLGVEVTAVKFVTPLFDYHLLSQPDYPDQIRSKYGINVRLGDLSHDYLELLRAPAHGFGRHFNPCLDCKILMLRRAREMMPELGAEFLISGEVVGQRPMSQRRDTLRVVERDSGCDDLLLRPLSAQHLKPTKPEREGLVDRDRLLGFAGRGRAGQMALAVELGIGDYPSPAGGCALTDPIIGERVKRFYREREAVRVADLRLLTVGRHLVMPGGAWLVMGRRQEENQVVTALVEPGDVRLRLADRPGPSGLVRYLRHPEDLSWAAGVVARYGKKGEDGRPAPGRVECQDETGVRLLAGVPPPEEWLRDWLR
ncbi:MAG: thiamine biosynthesis protein [Desulfobacteraceae bacterium]|nr:thiamine biosynthesis protein [Desulfobacteraceae bacterium]